MDATLKASKTCTLALWSLILGVLSLMCLGMFACVPAVVCGHLAQSRIKQSGGVLGGSGRLQDRDGGAQPKPLTH